MQMFIRFLVVTTIVYVISISVSAQSAKPAGPVPLTPAPSPSLAKDSRCFEIRTYTAPAGKLEELHARFRNHTLRIFKKHGMKVVGFWGPVDKEKGSENKLVYILAFPSREAREKAWKEFNDDPEWKKVKTESEKNGKIVDNVESVILLATDYSPVK